MIEISRLKTIVCGFEHGGTTLLATLLAQHPLLATGFEVGALLSDSPHRFWNNGNAWAGQRGLFTKTWGLTDDALVYIKGAKTFREFYHKLWIHSTVCDMDTLYLIDKTPQYQAHLVKLLDRFDVPAVVILKDPVLLWDSHRKHQSFTSPKQLIPYYNRRIAETNRAKAKYPNRVHIVKYEDLVLDVDPVMDALWEFLGLEPYSVGDFDVPWGQVHGNAIDPNEVWERYRRVPQVERDYIREHIPHHCYLKLENE